MKGVPSAKPSKVVRVVTVYGAHLRTFTRTHGLEPVAASAERYARMSAKEYGQDVYVLEYRLARIRRVRA